MRINALTVCVDYAGELARSLPLWRDGLDSLLVITAPRDEATKTLCRDAGVATYETDAFWRGGARFNKGAAVAEAVDSGRVPLSGWLLQFDADILPTHDWRQRLDGYDLMPGNLYGCRRWQHETGRLIRDRDVVGFFMLCHAADPNAQVRPFVDDCWDHAGNYDSTFAARWPRPNRIVLPIDMRHIGEPGRNWCGRGNDAAMRQLMEERRRRGGWRHETVLPEGT